MATPGFENKILTCSHGKVFGRDLLNSNKMQLASMSIVLFGLEIDFNFKIVFAEMDFIESKRVKFETFSACKGFSGSGIDNKLFFCVIISFEFSFELIFSSSMKFFNIFLKFG